VKILKAREEDCPGFAERFQTPVFILSDLDIGMNDWVCPRLKWDDAYRPDRGRVLEAKQLEEIPKYFRYSPENDDQVAARTLPRCSAGPTPAAPVKPGRGAL